MKKKTTLHHTKTYALARHHAWAGSVLLAILLAIRVFLEQTSNPISQTVFIIIGSLLIFYILISVIFTYKYRKELIQKQDQQHGHSIATHDYNTDKIELKIEKKKAKAKLKKQKKENKT